MTIKFILTADMREQRSGLTEILSKSSIIELKYADLPVGDFILSDDVVVERKESKDFITSIMDRRLFGQVAQMKATYAKPIILIEGDPFSVRSDITHDALRGALSWLVTIEGINLIYSKNIQDTAQLLEVMTRHSQEGLGYDVGLRSGKPKNLKVLSQFAVEGLPAVGPTTAKSLLAHFGSIDKIFKATAAELCEVKGIGKKTAEQIRELIEFKY